MANVKELLEREVRFLNASFDAHLVPDKCGDEYFIRDVKGYMEYVHGSCEHCLTFLRGMRTAFNIAESRTILKSAKESADALCKAYPHLLNL